MNYLICTHTACIEPVICVCFSCDCLFFIVCCRLFIILLSVLLKLAYIYMFSFQLFYCFLTCFLYLVCLFYFVRLFLWQIQNWRQRSTKHTEYSIFKMWFSLHPLCLKKICYPPSLRSYSSTRGRLSVWYRYDLYFFNNGLWKKDGL